MRGIIRRGPAWVIDGENQIPAPLHAPDGAPPHVGRVGEIKYKPRPGVRAGPVSENPLPRPAP